MLTVERMSEIYNLLQQNGVVRVDELAGEFDYCYKPVVNWLVNLGIRCAELLRTLRRKLGK